MEQALGTFLEWTSVRQVLLNCVKPTPESVFSDIIDPVINAAFVLEKQAAETILQ